MCLSIKQKGDLRTAAQSADKLIFVSPGAKAPHTLHRFIPRLKPGVYPRAKFVISLKQKGLSEDSPFMSAINKIYSPSFLTSSW